MKAEQTRPLYLFGGLAVLIALVFLWLGAAYGVRMLVEAACFALIALGLTIQWGYAGLFNTGVMGFIAIAAFASMIISYPVNSLFWQSDGPAMLGRAALLLIIGGSLTYLLSQSHRIGIPKTIRTLLTLMAAAATYLVVQSVLDPATTLIEREARFVGGFGLPVWLAWAAGGLAAGALGWAMGRITLGLRADYMAIATLGIAEIVKAFLKNADWLTKGTLTVSPLPWPVPTPNELGFVLSRSAYLSVVAVLIVVTYVLLERAWHSPWGRMMRAIRDNELSAAAMGKDINRRRLEMFVIGNIIIGIGGAALITFTSDLRSRRLHAAQPHVPDLGDGHPRRRGQQSRHHLRRASGLHHLDHVGAGCAVPVRPGRLLGRPPFRPRSARRSRDPRVADAGLRHRPRHHAGAAFRAEGPAAGKGSALRVGFGGNYKRKRPGIAPGPFFADVGPGQLTWPISLKPLPSMVISMITPGTSPAASNSWLPEAPS